MPNQVQPVSIKLDIKGGEQIAKLKGSFRDLAKTVGQSDAGIKAARKSIKDYAKSANQSEAVIRGQIKAFEGLREQAAMGGKVYSDLSGDINKLRSTLRGSSDAVERKRESLVKLGAASKGSANDLRLVIGQLEKLKSKIKEDSAAFSQLNKDIGRLNASLKEIEVSAGKARFAINTILSAKPEKITGQIENLSAAIASGKLEAEDLNAALRKLELLRVGAGRGPVAFRADVFSSQLGVDYFARLRKEYDNLEKTQAAITQRISEVNTELKNVTGYERRRSLTLELIRLNKELQQSVVDVTTREQFQAMAIRQRMGRSRETYAASGFGAFSAEVRQRTAGGEFTPGMQRARERARNQIINEEAVKATTDIFDTWEQVYGRIEDAARGHKVEMARIQAAQGQLLIEKQDQINDQLLRSNQAANDKELAAFDARLDRIEKLKSGEYVSRRALGLGGGDLSSLYGNIVGIGTSYARGQQEMMGRSPIQVFNDITSTFNRDLRRSGDPRIEAERQLRDTLVREFGAGSQKLKAALERIPMGKMTTAQLPSAGEDLSGYMERIQASTRGLEGALTGFGKKTTNELRQARQALVLFRDDLDPTTASFKRLEKESIASIERIDKELERRQRGRRRLSGMQMTQAAGAAISGGIFGGPEGFLGGVGGALVGGVGGAFAGAAIGAQLGGFRKQIGQYTEMAAEIQRLRLGLAGASNDFADFVNATQATEQASQRLLIPLADSYRIMTQLRANTVELGISTDDTRKIFEGITASIYKTGGGLAEVQGAMRAVVQVLSKGAPQAEELRGQLGERLPAAIIDFAKFTQRTPEELADAFQKSEVTLEEFVNFAKNKFKENEGYLDNLATNAEYAGRRYEKSLERLQLTLGRTFQTTGAALQDFASDFLSTIDRLITSLNDLGLVSKGPQALMQEFLSSGRGIKELDAELKTLEAQVAKMRKDKVGSFATDIIEPLFAFTVPAGTRKALEERIKNLKELRQIFDQLDQQTKKREKATKDAQDEAADKQRATSLLNAIEQRESAIAQARIQLEEQAANIRKQAIEQAKQLEESIAKQRLDKERQIEDLRRQLAYIEEDIALGAEEARFVAGGGDPEVFRVRREIIEFARQQKEEEISLDRQLLDEQTETQKAIEEFKSNNAKAIMEANTAHAKQIGRIQQEYARSVAKIVEEGTGRAGKRLEIAARLAAYYVDRASINYQRAELGANVIPTAAGVSAGGQPIYTGMSSEEVPGAIQDIDKQIAKAAKELYQLPTATTIAAPAIDSISMSFNDLNSSLAASATRLEGVRDQVRAIRRDVSGAEILKKVSDVFAQQGAGIGATQRTMQSEAQKRSNVLRYREEGFSENVAQQLAEQEAQVISSLKNLEAARDEALKQFPGQQEEIRQKFVEMSEAIRGSHDAVRDLTIALDNIPTEIKLRSTIADLKLQLRELVDPANQIKGAATAIGDAFATSFVDAITGAKTAQEALSEFFKSVASYFLDMAKQIIAKMITIAILNTIVKLLPGSPGGGGGGGGPNLEAMTQYSGIGANTRVPGFADGGRPQVGQMSIVGERGPELFVPDTAGTVVPNNQLSSAMNRYRRSGETSGGSALGSAAESGGAGTAVMDKPIDVRYTVERINSVDYVTADQFQSGMQQAARQGAQRGEQQTLKRLQMSSSTRKRLGL